MMFVLIMFGIVRILMIFELSKIIEVTKTHNPGAFPGNKSPRMVWTWYQLAKTFAAAIMYSNDDEWLNIHASWPDHK